MKKNSNEFIEFMTSDIESLPKEVEIKFLKNLKRKVEPLISDIWPKFVIAQLLAALATLSVCPQFGVGPIGNGHGLGHFFMRFGEVGCAAFCGAFFLATGTLFASVLLRKGERREVFRYRFRIIGAVSVICFLTFMILGKFLNLPMLYSGTVPYLSWWLAAAFSSLAVMQVMKGSVRFAQGHH